MQQENRYLPVKNIGNRTLFLFAQAQNCLRRSTRFWVETAVGRVAPAARLSRFCLKRGCWKSFKFDVLYCQFTFSSASKAQHFLLCGNNGVSCRKIKIISIYIRNTAFRQQFPYKISPFLAILINIVKIVAKPQSIPDISEAVSTNFHL